MSVGRGKSQMQYQGPGLRSPEVAEKKPCPFFKLGLCSLLTSCKFSHGSRDQTSTSIQEHKLNGSPGSGESEKLFTSSTFEELYRSGMTKSFSTHFDEEFPDLNMNLKPSNEPVTCSEPHVSKRGLEMAAEILAPKAHHTLYSSEINTSSLRSTYGSSPTVRGPPPGIVQNQILRRPIVQKGYYCYGCKKNVPFLMRNVQCPFCYGTFVEEQRTAESFISALEVSLDLPKLDPQEALKKNFYCHKCGSIVKANADLTCKVCNGEFLEEKPDGEIDALKTSKLEKPMERSKSEGGDFAIHKSTAKTGNLKSQRPKAVEEKMSPISRLETKNRFAGLQVEEKNEIEKRDDGQKSFTKVLSKRQKKRLKQKRQKAVAESREQTGDEKALGVWEGLVKTLANRFLTEAMSSPKTTIQSTCPSVEALDFDKYSNKELYSLLLWYGNKIEDTFGDNNLGQIILYLTAALLVAKKLPDNENITKVERNVCILRSIAFLAGGRYSEGIEEASKCLGDRNPLPHQVRAECYRRLGNEKLAIHDTVSAINIDPKLVRSLAQK